MIRPEWLRSGSRLLARGVDEELREYVVADVERRYRQLRRDEGLLRAQRWLLRQIVIGLLPMPSSPPPPDPRSPRSTAVNLSSFFSALVRDLRFSLRELLIKNPLPTLVAVLTLALGIGVNTAIFSVLHAVLLRPLPFAEPGELAMIWNDAARGETTWISAAELFDYREELDGVLQIAAFTDQQVNVTGAGEPQRVLAAVVTGNYFDVLGIRAARGRTLAASEEGPDVAPMAVISDGLWRRTFGADPDVVGRDVLIDGRARTLVGILPPATRLPLDYREETRTDLYLPLPVDRSNMQHRGARSFHAVVRRAPGVTPDVARQALAEVHGRWEADGLFGTGSFNAPGLIGLEELLFGESRPMLMILAGAAGFVLAIACANVASMMLARGEARRREIGVRVAMGASRMRVARQLVTESMVLAFMGGGLALVMAASSLGMVRRWGPQHVPRLADVAFDTPLLLIALGVSAMTGLLFGLLPAVQAAGTEPKDLLVDTHAAGRGRHRLRRTLVVGELGLAVMLAVAAMLMVRSFVHVRSTELGFAPENVLTLRLELPTATYPDSAARTAFWTRLVERIETIPGVEAAGAARRLPLASRMGNWSITIEGRELAPGENPNGDFQVVMPGYFEAMGAELVRGRLLRRSDRADTAPVVVVSEAMAETYWPGEDAIGKRFRIGDETTPWYEIVGIVRGMRHNTVLEGPRTEMYHSVPQWSLGATAPAGMSVVVRTEGDATALVEPVRRTIRELDQALPVADVRRMREIVANASADTRFSAALLGMFGVVALLLAATGIYGVVSYSVKQRTRDIGIRMAIGAEQSRVLVDVLRDSTASLALGLGLGVTGALALGGYVAGLLVGVDPVDPLSYSVVVVTVSVVTLLSALIPARRAATIDPIVALRED